MHWFLCFFFYSFLGFLLELVYARITRSRKPDRKCLFFLPLCPVYGFGALAILSLAPFLSSRPLLMALAGGAAATAVEFSVGLFYERALGVSFWDYSALPLNVGGKICLPFAAAWCVLSAALVYLIHPRILPLLMFLPPVLSPALLLLTATDSILSLYLLKGTGTTDALKWYVPSRGSRS